MGNYKGTGYDLAVKVLGTWRERRLDCWLMIEWSLENFLKCQQRFYHRGKAF